MMRIQSENSLDSFTSSKFNSQTSISSTECFSQITTKTNSLSKNELSILRENTGESRQRSAQKLNSPFADKLNRSHSANLIGVASKSTNVLKAKRQISFE
jgi:hypothetical protein